MTVTVTVRMDPRVVHRMINDPTGPVARDLRRRAVRVEARAKQLAPVDTGRLRASIHIVGPLLVGGRLVFYVVTASGYGRWVHDGRQPGRQPPTLALEGWARRHGAGGAEFVIARAVGRRGIPARPFLVDALAVAAG